MTFDRARAYCENCGGHLPEPRSPREYNELSGFNADSGLANGQVFLGMIRLKDTPKGKTEKGYDLSPKSILCTLISRKTDC